MAEIVRLGDIAKNITKTLDVKAIIPNNPNVDINKNDSQSIEDTMYDALNSVTYAKFEKEEELRCHIAMCKSCHISKEFYNKTFDDYKPQNNIQKEALRAVMNLTSAKCGKIVLIGSNGLGKTHLASVATKILHGKIYTMFEISNIIRQTYKVGSLKTEYDILQELATLPFLAIDEIGRTKSSDAEQNWLSYIVDKRHTEELPLMFLTNRKLYNDCQTPFEKSFALENYIPQDVMSRLSDAQWILLSGVDYRTRCIK